MSSLRHAHRLARFVLVWFVLSIGVAVASPLVQPKALSWVCASAGALKLVTVSNDGAPAPASALLDCPLCANLGAPPPPLHCSVVSLAQPPALVLHSVATAHIAAVAAAPLPARGPPSVL